MENANGDVNTFDNTNQTELGFNDEIWLTDALSKFDELYVLKFEGNVFNIENRLEWLKSSIDYVMYDDGFKDDLINYMKLLWVNPYVR